MRLLLFFVDTNYIEFLKSTGGSVQHLQVKETAALITKVKDEVRTEILNLINSF